MLDYIFYWLFGISFCILTGRYCSVWRSMKALDPRSSPAPSITLAVHGRWICGVLRRTILLRPQSDGTP
eukprot:s700_g13.t1